MRVSSSITGRNSSKHLKTLDQPDVANFEVQNSFQLYLCHSSV